MEKMKVKITTIENMLGSLPGDSEVYRNYIASKAPKPEEILAEELAALNVDEEFSKACTIFAKDKDGNPILFDYVFKGFFKNACKALRESDEGKSKGLSAYKTKIDNLVFVGPRQVRINTDSPITICERPLRASTAQGERVALSASEEIQAGAVMEIEITTLNKQMMELVCEWLDYGVFNGLGQWHNSGKGRFIWQNISDREETKETKKKTTAKKTDKGEVVVTEEEAAPAPKKRGRKPKTAK